MIMMKNISKNELRYEYIIHFMYSSHNTVFKVIRNMIRKIINKSRRNI